VTKFVLRIHTGTHLQNVFVPEQMKEEKREQMKEKVLYYRHFKDTE